MRHCLIATVLAAAVLSTAHVTIVADQDLTTAEQQLVTRFAHAFETGMAVSFGPLTPSGAIDGGSWISVRDVLESFRDISVKAWRVTIEKDTGGRRLRLDIDASGTSANGARARRRLPKVWYLTLGDTNGQAVIDGAATEEATTARAILDAPDERHRRGVFDRHPDLDRRLFLSTARTLAVAAAQSDPSAAGLEWPRVRAGLEFLRDQAEGASDKAGEALILAALSSGALERKEDARPLADKALTAAAASGDPDAMASAHFALGNWLTRVGDRKGLEELSRVARDIDALVDPRIALKALLNLAVNSVDRRALHEAVLVADRLALESKRFGWGEGEAMASWVRADVHNALHRPELAAVFLREAYETLSRVAHLSWAALALVELAAAEMAEGRIDEAMPRLQQALALGRNRSSAYWRSELLASAVPALLAAGKVLEASRLVDESATLGVRSRNAGVADAEVRLIRGDAEGALRIATEEIWREDVPDWLQSTLAGRALRALGRRQEAERQIRRAIDLIEERRATLPAGGVARASFFADKLQPYRELLAMLLDEQRAQEAFGIAERMKGQALQLSLEQGSVDLSSTMDGAEREQERTLDESIATLNRQLLAAGGEPAARLRAERDAARRQLELFRFDLYLRHPAVAARRVPDGEPLAAIAEALPPGGTALELTVLEQETIAFVVTRVNDRVTIDATRIPISRAALERDVTALADAIERRNPGAAAISASLSKRLVGPIERQLASVRQLTIVPDGVLWRLPWEVLPESGGGLLVERMSFGRAPSLQLLARTRHAAAGAPTPPVSALRLLALGDPRITAATDHRVRALQRGAALGALPEAAREVRAVGRLYGTGRSEVLVGAGASEELFKRVASRFDVLHLATHGVLDDRAPMFSALALAAGRETGGDDGLLEAREIAELRLRARLVVLSACDTARGRVEAGEGVIGLSWAFLAAGVPTLVASGWKTDSAATERLMVAFHRGLLMNLSAAEALRRAEVALLRDRRYAHPYYWAPFVVVGDGW